MDFKPQTDQVLGNAFRIWWQNIGYHLLFSIIFFGLMVLSAYLLNMSYPVFDRIMELQKYFSDVELLQEKIQALAQSEDFLKFSLGFNLVQAFLYPLNLGLYRVYDLKAKRQPIKFSDLISGYQGLSFLAHFGYYLFWFAVYSLLSQTVILSPIWILVTMMVSPLMFYRKLGIFNAIGESFKMLKTYPALIIVGMLVAVAVKYFGLMLIFLFPFTYPFWMAMIYAIYTAITPESTPTQNPSYPHSV